MWLPIVIYVPALAFNQGKWTPTYMYKYSPVKVVQKINIQSKNSYGCECSSNYTNCMHCVHILYMCRWAQGSCMDRCCTIGDDVWCHCVGNNQRNNRRWWLRIRLAKSVGERTYRRTRVGHKFYKMYCNCTTTTHIYIVVQWAQPIWLLLLFVSRWKYNRNVIYFLCSLSFDLKTRYTLYSLSFGGFAYWLKSNAVSQNMIQRYLALPTLGHARR